MRSDITIVIPAYNAGRFIEETLRSALNQTVPADEVIVVDDASTDDTVKKVRAFGSAVRLIHFHKNSRVASKPRNTGIAHARTRYIVPFDADDVMYPRRLERPLALLRMRPELRVAFCDFHVLRGGLPQPVSHCIAHPHFRQYLERLADGFHLMPQPETIDAFMFENYIGSGGLLLERSAWEEVGGYDERLRSAEDLDFNLRLAQRFEIGFVDEPLYAYRVHAGGKSANKISNYSSALNLMRGQLARPMPRHAAEALREQIFVFENDLACLNGDQLHVAETWKHWWEALKFGGPRRELLRPGRRMLRAITQRDT